MADSLLRKAREGGRRTRTNRIEMTDDRLSLERPGSSVKRCDASGRTLPMPNAASSGRALPAASLRAYGIDAAIHRLRLKNERQGMLQRPGADRFDKIKDIFKFYVSARNAHAMESIAPPARSSAFLTLSRRQGSLPMYRWTAPHGACVPASGGRA
ncbi:MAG: hypothetical protein ACLGPL_01750 [Acidobacteriota bacterium]